jgi:hypothetical protein
MRKMMAAVLIACAVAGCGGDSTGPEGGDGSAFDISVGSGRNPTYTWSGGTAFSVSVVRVSAPGTIVWGVANPAMTIPSPVTHGVTPGGAVVSANTEGTLTTGVKYRVSITRQDQKTGFKEFTP